MPFKRGFLLRETPPRVCRLFPSVLRECFSVSIFDAVGQGQSRAKFKEPKHLGQRSKLKEVQTARTVFQSARHRRRENYACPPTRHANHGRIAFFARAHEENRKHGRGPKRAHQLRRGGRLQRYQSGVSDGLRAAPITLELSPRRGTHHSSRRKLRASRPCCEHSGGRTIGPDEAPRQVPASPASLLPSAIQGGAQRRSRCRSGSVTRKRATLVFAFAAPSVHGPPPAAPSGLRSARPRPQRDRPAISGDISRYKPRLGAGRKIKSTMGWNSVSRSVLSTGKKKRQPLQMDRDRQASKQLATKR